jgi:hypothetical protein
MVFPIAKYRNAVNRLGAEPGSVLRGVADNNQGLRLRSTQAQARGHDGPIEGPFVIVDAGTNRHSEILSTLLHKETNAQEVLVLLRRKHPACVNVVNANSLIVENDQNPNGEQAPGEANSSRGAQ